MKCPKCREWMPIEATQHACGWRTSVPSAGPVRELREVPKRASPEVVEASLAKMREILKSRR